MFYNWRIRFQAVFSSLPPFNCSERCQAPDSFFSGLPWLSHPENGTLYLLPVNRQSVLFFFLIQQYLSLCLKWTREVRKNGRSKICPFLYSNGHTEAKKIPENFFHWYHFLCYKKICLNFSKCFSGHFAKKIFFGCNQFLDLPDEF